MTALNLLAFGVLMLVVGTIHVVLVRPRINQWGASDHEHVSTWPGDELVAQPSFVWTNAITIKAPAAKIWPWLVQLGQGRGGLYSYDWLENLIGCDVHGADLAAGHARSSWAFILQPVDQDSTRFLIRCRGNSLMARLQGPVQFVMQRKMMLGIKQHAERSSSSPSGIAVGRPLPEQRDPVTPGSSKQFREAS